MAEETPSLHIDSDWKKQAQEEKRKLAELEKAKQASTQTAVSATPVTPGTGKPGAVEPALRPGRQLPRPGFGSLVQSVMTQILYYLGELPSSGGQATLDMDLARHHLDTLTMLEDKTRNNLSGEEQSLLDAALYETRTRFVNAASQMLGP